MAYYASLISLSQTLEQIPQPVYQFASLPEKVARLLEILEDSSQTSSLKINHLEGRITDAAYEAEDIVESVVSRRIVSRYHRFSYIMDEFDSILEALSDDLRHGKVDHLQPAGQSVSGGSSRVVASDKSAPVGLDKDLMGIKDRLTGSTSKLDIVSIVGMGGIGKTTLARNLYNDSLIEYHFDIRAWTVVSQAYQVREMLMSLLGSIRHGEVELHHKEIGKLEELLYKGLKGRRYLIVLDDVWNTKAWDDVRRFFPDDNNGSRIILTTRLSEVAIYANSHSHIHHMNLLSPEESWNLLREKVFGEERCSFAFEKIGKIIATNCKGLPLAVVVVSGILCKGSRTELYWEYVAENVKSKVTENDDQFMEILSWSYNSLPSHLKPCFLYMGVFPEDYEIFASHLIKLWIAEGFVKSQAPKSLEEVAEDYLKNLNDRSLITVCRRNHNGGIKTCIIHDLLRELCVKKSEDEQFLQIRNPSVSPLLEGINIQRRVSVHEQLEKGLPRVCDSLVRSLLYFYRGWSNHQLLSFTMSSRLLRVLDALTIRFDEFPVEIVELVHLRYLAFIFRGEGQFPASISKLHNLQTLIVYRGEFLSFKGTLLYMPSNIWEMTQLRHLVLETCFLPYPLPAQIVRKDSPVVLENLQTLTGLVRFKCTREVFEIMPNLKKLGLVYFHDTNSNWSSYKFNNFVYLHQLETLKCLFIAESVQAQRPLPVNFALPSSLRKLTLSGCRISWKKMTVIGSLPNLEVLKLKDEAFKGSVWEPNEGEFCNLKFLLIQKSSLEHWRANDTHFPNLRHLSLSLCYKLVEIPYEIGEIPTLEMLELCECSPSAVASAMVIQEEQRSLDNNTFRVRVSSFQDNHDSHQKTSLRKVHRALPSWY